MTLRLTHLLALCTLIFSLVGVHSASAASIGKTLSGNSRVNCPKFELINLGPFLPEGRAEVVSGVTGQSRLYTMLTNDPIHVWNITYTLAPSISSPAYEETELQYKKGQGIKTYDCGDNVEEDDRELNQYYIDFEAWIQAKGRIWGLTYGSNAESTVLVRNKAVKDGSNRASGMHDFHSIRLAQAVTGSPTVSVAATGNTTGSSNGSDDDVAGSLSESAGGTPINETVSAFSLLFDANGNVIGGARSAPEASCGSDLTYVAGASGLTSRSSAREINRTIEHRFGQPAEVTSVNEAVSAGLVARTLGTTRPVIYYGVPQILVDQGICSSTTLSWDPSATAYTCTPSISSGDILTLQSQNPGSTIQTYFAQETAAPGFPFPSQADWVAQRNSVEGDMMDYSAQVPLTINSCNDTPDVGDGPPLDDTPLSCTVTVAATPNPALLGTGVVWTTEVRNALGPITYEWTGTDNLSRFITKTQTSDELSRSYQLTGTKNANVSITNNGRTAICTQSIPVVRPMNATCSPDVTETEAGNIVNWTATVTGGQAPFTYAWSGTDNLSGTRISVAKQYNTAGTKVAQVVVTDSQNATRTVPCTSSVNVTQRTNTPIEYDLNITVRGEGAVTWNGNTCQEGSGVCSGKFLENTEVTLTSGALSSNAVFTGWSGSLSGTLNTASVVMNGDKNVVASFSSLPGNTSLDARAPSCADGSGRINLSWGSASGATGYIIQRSTSATSGFSTLQDSSSVPLSINGTVVTVTRPGGATTYSDSGLTPGARYYYRITPVNGNGVGATSSDNTTASTLCSLSCSVTADAPSGQVTHGTNINVTSNGSAIGATTYRVDCGNGTSFDGSSGQCRYPIAGAYTVTASASRSGATPASCTTTVNAQAANKVLSVSKVGNGICTVTGPGINCGNDCAESYAHGSTQTVTVTPASGSEFIGWSGDCSETGDCSVVMDTSRSVTATCNVVSPIPACSIDLKSRTASDSALKDGSNKLGFNEILTLSYSGSNLSGNTTFTSSPFSGFWTGSEAASNSTRTKQVSNVTSQRNYTFSIEGRNSQGAVCTDSVSIGVKPATPSLNAPNVQCDAGVPVVNLSWNRSTFSDSFLVSRGFGNTNPVLVSNYTGCSGNSCTYEDRTAVSGNTYSYQVRANNEHGSSQLSTPRSITIPVCPVSKPDLRSSGSALRDSSRFKVGDTNAVTTTIINSGNADTAVSAWADRVTVRLPDGTETTTTVARSGALPVNNTYSLSTGDITYTQEGIHRAIFCADVGALVDESNEDNNCTEFQFSVRTDDPVPDPDPDPDPEDPIIFPALDCSMVVDPSVATLGSLVSYRASATGGNGTYTYDWKQPNGTEWGADTTTTETSSSRSTTFNLADNYTALLRVSSWVGPSDNATFTTVECSATHTAQDPTPRSGLDLTYERECRIDGTILWDRVVVDGWRGRSQWPISVISRTGGAPRDQIFVGCGVNGQPCGTWDTLVEPGQTYTYSGQQLDQWPTSTSRVNIGTDSITIPANNCPVVPQPECSFNVDSTVTGWNVWANVQNTPGTSSFAWDCDDFPPSVTNNGWRSMSYSTRGTKECRVTPQDGANRGRTATCSIEVKEAFECYATVNGERVTEAPVGSRVDWKYDVNHPEFAPQTEQSFTASRRWHVIDTDPGTEQYQIRNAFNPAWMWSSKSIEWWPAWPWVRESYATTTIQYRGRRNSTDKDFSITYVTPGVKTIEGRHRISDGSGAIGSVRWQNEQCSITIVEPPIELGCQAVVATDRNVIPFPGPPTNPSSADYQAFQFGSVVDGVKTESQIDAMTFDVRVNKGDGTGTTTIRRSGAQLRSGEGLALTYGDEGTYTPYMEVQEVGGSNRVSSVAQCPNVIVGSAPTCDFTINTQQLMRVEQDERFPAQVSVVSTGGADPEAIDFSQSNGVELIPGVVATFDPIDCDPDLASCNVTMWLEVASDAPGTPAPALASITGRSNFCDLEKSKVFFIDVRDNPGATGLDVDMWTDDGQGDIKLKGVKDGTVRVEPGDDLFLKWETREDGRVIGGGNAMLESKTLNTMALINRVLGIETARASGLIGGPLALVVGDYRLDTTASQIVDSLGGTKALQNISEGVLYDIAVVNTVNGNADEDTVTIEIVSDPSFEEF